LAFVGKEIFESGRMLLIKPRPDHSLFFKSFEPRGQRIRRDAREPRLQIMKPQRTLAKQIPEHEQRPFFADDIEGLGTRGILVMSACPG
jgi:hypothetical protein